MPTRADLAREKLVGCMKKYRDIKGKYETGCQQLILEYCMLTAKDLGVDELRSAPFCLGYLEGYVSGVCLALEKRDYYNPFEQNKEKNSEKKTSEE